MAVLIFLGIILTIVALIHLYLWQRLVRDVAVPGRRHRLGGFGLLAGALLVVATVLVDSWLPRSVQPWVSAVGYLWLGMMFYLLLALLALELPVLVARLVAARRARWTSQTRREPVAVTAGPPAPDALPSGVPAPDALAAEPSGADVPGGDVPGGDVPGGAAGSGVSRRRVLRRVAAITAGAAAVGISGYGVSRAFSPPRVTRLSVPLARLDPRADGLRVAVVGDVHASPLLRAGQVARVVDIVNDLDADLVAVVGDTVSNEVDQVRESLAELARLRGRHGTFFVTGNHEYYTGHEQWLEAVEDLGVRVLRNERVEITHGGGVVDLAGVNDPEGARHEDPADYQAALGDRDPTRPVLLLAHQPVQVHEAAAYGVDLQLSGHTHGGQVYPFDYLVRLQQPVVSGLAEVDGTLVYVTNGAGFWGPPMRVGADPEVTLLELRATA